MKQKKAVQHYIVAPLAPREGDETLPSPFTGIGTVGNLFIAHWISVKDRLPEEDENFLVWLDMPGVATFAMIAEWEEGEWFDLGSADPMSPGAAGCITHWMPLPEPPK